MRITLADERQNIDGIRCLLAYSTTSTRPSLANVFLRNVVKATAASPPSSNNNCKPFWRKKKPKQSPVKIEPDQAPLTMTYSRSSICPESEYYQVMTSPRTFPKRNNEGLCLVFEGDTVNCGTQVSRHEQFCQVNSNRESFLQCAEFRRVLSGASTAASIGDSEKLLAKLESKLSSNLKCQHDKPMSKYLEPNLSPNLKCQHDNPMKTLLESSKNMQCQHDNPMKKYLESSATISGSDESHCVYCIMKHLQSLPPCCLERAVNSFITQSLSTCSVKAPCCHRHSNN